MVVISIILVLGAIAVLFVPRAQDGDKAAGGARQFMGMLQIAKTRAMRDRAPRGVRLLVSNPSAANPLLLPTQITDLQYIEQPADFYDPNIPIMFPGGPGAGPVVTFNGDLSGGFSHITSNPPLPPTSWPVQQGDYLEVSDGGLLYRIAPLTPGTLAVNPTQVSATPLLIHTTVGIAVINTQATLVGGKPAPGVARINLAGAPPSGIQVGTSLTLGIGPAQETATVYGIMGPTLTVSRCTQTAKSFPVQNDPPLSFPAGCPYRIIRSPRVVAGEDGLTLPVGVAIQLNATATATYDPPVSSPPPTVTPAPAGTVWCDILFSPSGAVVGSAAGSDKIILWVRDVTQPNVTDNNPLLVCIYTRSGLIAAHPVDVTPGGNPYSFTVDGKSSGE